MSLRDQSSIDQIVDSLYHVEIREECAIPDLSDGPAAVDPLPCLRLPLRNRRRSLLVRSAPGHQTHRVRARNTPEDELARRDLLLGARQLVQGPCRFEKN